MIEVRDLRFTYRVGDFALTCPRLRVEGGEKVAIVGPSGCGKTTLLNLLSGVLSAGNGTIEFESTELSSLTPEDRQDLRALRMGMVFQEFELLEYLHVLDNVLLPYRMSPVLNLTNEVRERARSLVHEVGLGAKETRYPRNLSEGERQRIAVCRALVTQPRVVFGDEPTANLDPANKEHVLDILFGAVANRGTALVLVTHDHELLSRFDRVLDFSAIQHGGQP